MTGTDLLHRRRDAIKRRSRSMPPREIFTATKKEELGKKWMRSEFLLQVLAFRLDPL